MSIGVVLAGSSRLLSRMTSTAWSLNCPVPNRRGTRIYRDPVVATGGIANELTWPQCGPTACWVPFSMGIPFCEIMCSSVSGLPAIRVGHLDSVLATTSGGIDRLVVLGGIAIGLVAVGHARRRDADVRIRFPRAAGESPSVVLTSSG